MDWSRSVEHENKIHHLVQWAVTADGPSGLQGASDLTGAGGEAAKIGLPKSTVDEGACQHFAEPRTGLVDVVGEGECGYGLHFVFGGEVVPALFGQAIEFLADTRDAAIDLVEWLEKDAAADDEEEHQTHQPTDEGEEFLFAVVHRAPPFRGASRETSSAGRAGGVSLVRSNLSLDGTVSSTVVRKL